MSCDPAGAARVAIADLDDNFDLRLADGRNAVMSGVSFAPAGARPADIAAALAGRDLFMKALAEKTDRWGRMRIRLYVRPADGANETLLDAGVDMIRRGLAFYRPDSDAVACRGALLSAERQAERSRAGVWATAAILDGSNRDAVAGAPQGFLIVEGIVVSVGTAGGRVYLNMGKTRTVDLAIVILRSNIQAFEAQGFGLQQLTGRRIRVRGLLDRRFGPQIEIATPDSLEILEPAMEGEAGRR